MDTIITATATAGSDTRERRIARSLLAGQEAVAFHSLMRYAT
ncbi:MAG TPA: hypothetical protein VNP53_04480 [Methylomirabilota bacterium]|nr:hypothetical protein [Methylomirabilota bacterium]